MIRNRRSVRKFTSTRVPEDHMRQILDAARMAPTSSIPVDLTMEVLEIPDRYTRVCITPVGVPVEWPETPEKKPLEEFIVRDRF